MRAGKYAAAKRLLLALSVGLPVVWLGTLGSVWARDRFGLGQDVATALGMLAILMGVSVAGLLAAARESGGSDAERSRAARGVPWFLRLAVLCSAGAAAWVVYRGWYEGRLPDGRAALLMAAILAVGLLVGRALRDRPSASRPRWRRTKRPDNGRKPPPSGRCPEGGGFRPGEPPPG